LALFAVLYLAPPTDLSEITVGPNPLRPTVFPGQLMVFRNLPAGASVRIYTYLGEKLADLTGDAAGIASWDGKNRRGSWVASGVYIVLVEGNGAKKTLRVAIER
jgi:hypothetical protein